MKERKIKIVITLMSIAVLGLIAIQIFWISHALSIEKMRFETNVNEALTRVVGKADKIETASVVLEKLLPDPDSLLVLNEDSLSTSRKYLWTNKMSKNVEIRTMPQGEVRIEYSGKLDSSVIHVMTTSKSDTLHDVRRFSEGNEQIDSFFVRKSELVRTVVDELIFSSERAGRKFYFPEAVIDSLLQSELNNKGITTEYYFSISSNKNDVRFFDTDSESVLQPSDAYKVQLNPDDIFHEASFLSVYFPDKDFFIIKSIVSVLAISVVLIFIIIAVFYKTIQMLLRQKRLTEIKNELINNITHEFKTPISTISLACEALNEPVLLQNPNSVTRYTSIINDENKRLSNLVENLLNTAAIEKDKFKLDKSEIDLHSILTEVINNYRIKFEQKNAEVELALNAENHVVVADEFHITNCFNNLIDNAFKYTRKNPRIIVETESGDGYITIKITDNGIGIRKQDIDRIFDTFYRVPTGNIHDVKGNGIGLSYVKKMIEAHGGTVAVKSKIDNGSSFTVRIPHE